MLLHNRKESTSRGWTSCWKSASWRPSGQTPANRRRAAWGESRKEDAGHAGPPQRNVLPSASLKCAVLTRQLELIARCLSHDTLVAILVTIVPSSPYHLVSFALEPMWQGIIWKLLMILITVLLSQVSFVPNHSGKLGILKLLFCGSGQLSTTCKFKICSSQRLGLPEGSIDSSYYPLIL